MPQGDFYNNFLFSLAGLLVLYLSFCYLIRWTTYVYGPPLGVSWYFSSCSWNLIVKKKVKVSLIFLFILYSLKTKWTFFIWKTDLINGKIFNNLATLFLSLVSMGTKHFEVKGQVTSFLSSTSAAILQCQNSDSISFLSLPGLSPWWWWREPSWDATQATLNLEPGLKVSTSLSWRQPKALNAVGLVCTPPR